MVNPYKVFFSSVFFLLFVFSMFALLVSQFNDTFSQLFLILTRDDRAYSLITDFLYFCGIVMCIGYLILSTWRDKDALLQRLVSMFICIVLVFVLIFSLSAQESFENIIFINSTAYGLRNLGFLDLFKLNIVDIIISGFFYLFFLICPLILYGFGYGINTKHGIGKYLEFFCPSMNVCLVTLFASGFQGYYNKSNPYLYIDFFAFCLCLGFFIYVYKTHKKFFSFYEYANILVLSVGIIICMLCSNVLGQSQDYYNARMSFYILAFLGWCGEWMYKSLKQ